MFYVLSFCLRNKKKNICLNSPLNWSYASRVSQFANTKMPFFPNGAQRTTNVWCHDQMQIDKADRPTKPDKIYKTIQSFDFFYNVVIKLKFCETGETPQVVDL